MFVLGIESSCDETAASIVFKGRKILSSVIYSQIKIHHPYGGIVPELASRKHIESIIPVVKEAIYKSGLNIKNINGIAVTRGPGLIGSLLVGFSFAKGLAFSQEIPLVGVNHLEGHINSVFLKSNSPKFPFIAMLVSGGHTNIYYVLSHTDYELMGETRDDAVGEAYDKVAKMLGLGYPGGKKIESLSENGNSSFIFFKRPFLNKNNFDFSFSGIKSAVNRHISTNHKLTDRYKSDIAASFQQAVIEVLVHKAINAAIFKQCKSIALVGGVAANKKLAIEVKKAASLKNIKVYVPSIDLCGDNAAMIAAVGYHYLKNKKTSSMQDDVFSR